MLRWQCLRDGCRQLTLTGFVALRCAVLTSPGCWFLLCQEPLSPLLVVCRSFVREEATSGLTLKPLYSTSGFYPTPRVCILFLWLLRGSCPHLLGAHSQQSSRYERRGHEAKLHQPMEDVIVLRRWRSLACHDLYGLMGGHDCEIRPQKLAWKLPCQVPGHPTAR